MATIANSSVLRCWGHLQPLQTRVNLHSMFYLFISGVHSVFEQLVKFLRCSKVECATICINLQPVLDTSCDAQRS